MDGSLGYLGRNLDAFYDGKKVLRRSERTNSAVLGHLNGDVTSNTAFLGYLSESIDTPVRLSIY